VGSVYVSNGLILGSGTLTSTAGQFYFVGANVTPNLAGSVNATITTPGTTTLSGNNSYSGRTYLSGSAILSLANANALAGSTLSTYSNGSPVQLSAPGTNTYNFGGLEGSLNLNFGANSLSIGANNEDTSFGSSTGILSGSGTVTKVGNGTLTLLGNNTYSGVTTISAGTLALGNGGTSGSVTGDITNNANLVFNRSGNSTYSDTISGAGNFTKAGSGILNLNGAQTYIGTTTISGGTLGLVGSIASTSVAISSGATLLNQNSGLSASSSIVNEGTFTINASETIGSLSGTGNTILNAALTTGALGTADLISGTISGNGSLVKSGTGTLSLSGSNTYNGSTTISAGTLQLGNGGTSGSITGNITNNAALAFNRTDNITYNGSVSGTGTVNKLGTGTTTLSGANTYTGSTTISAGTLEGNSQSIQGSISNNASVVFNQSTNGTYAGIMSGNGTLSKIGNGALTLSGNNTFTGGTTVDAGTLIASGMVGDVTNYASFIVETAGTAGDVTNFFGATGSNNGTMSSLSNLGTFTSSGNITGDILSFGSSVTIGQGGVVSGNSTIGGGEFVVAGAVANVSNNALMRVETGGTAGEITNLGNATTTNNGTVASLLSSGAFTNSGNITGSVISFGTLESSGAIGGSLIVGGGVTTINGTVAGATTVTVAETAGILQGTGTLGELEILSGGTVAPGTVGTIGNLTAGNMTWNSGGVYNWQTSSLNGTGTPGSAWDLISSNGSLIINASANSTVGIRVTSLGGNLTNDIKKAEWEIGNFDGGITGYNKSFFSINATELGARGRFFVTAEEHSLMLNYKTAAVWLGGTGNWTTAALWEDNYIAVNGDEVEFSGNGGTSTNNNLNSVASLTFTSIASGSYTLNGNALAVGAAGIVNDSEFEQTIALNLTGGEVLGVNTATSNLTISGVISGNSALTKVGNKTLTLSGNNTYTGGTIVSAGTLAGTTEGLKGAIVNNSVVTFNQSFNGTYAGAMTGAGSVTKSGSGVVLLSGNNTFSGGTTTNAGVLAAAVVGGNNVVSLNPNAFGNGSVNINAGGAILVPSTTLGGSRLALGGDLTLNNGTIAFYDIGTSPAGQDLRIDVAGNFTNAGNGVVIDFSQVQALDSGDYTLVSYNGTNFATSAISSRAGVGTTLQGSFSMNGSSLVYKVLGAQSSGTDIQNNGGPNTPIVANYTINQPGVVTIGDNNSVAALTFNSGGTLNIQQNGVLNVSSGTLNVQNGSSVVGGGTLVAPAGLNKDGTGELDFTNNVVVTGTAAVNAGLLSVNGQLQATGGVVVNPNATLGGAGLIVGNVNVNGGNISPGNSPGTLSVAGNLVLTGANATLIEIASPTNFDRIVVSGTATLGGTLNAVAYGGGTITPGARYDFLQAGSIDGEFDSLIAPDGLRIRFLNSGTVGSLLFGPASFVPYALNQNQINVAKALDIFVLATEGDAIVVGTALDSLTTEQFPAAFDQIMPGFYESLANMAIEQAFNQTQMLNQRISSVRLGAAGFQAIGGISQPLVHDKNGKSAAEAKDASPIVESATATNWNAWALGTGMFSRSTNLGSLQNYNNDAGGFLVGSDYRWSENFVTGLYGGYDYSYAEYNGGGSTKGNSFSFGTYASYAKDGYYADAVIGGGYTGFQTQRSIEFSTIDRTASADPNSGQFTAGLNLGKDFEVGKFTLGPIVGAQYTYAGIGSFTESGAESLDLSLGQQNANSLRSTLGGRIAYTWNLNQKIALIPEVRMFWQHEFLNNPRNINASLDGGNGPSFDYESTDPYRNSVFAGAGVTAQFGKNLSGSVFYNINFGSQTYQNNMVSAGLNLSF
jgi:autotransporter-associated beta strand protein